MLWRFGTLKATSSRQRKVLHTYNYNESSNYNESRFLVERSADCGAQPKIWIH